jgi:hypothetical protein
MLLAEHRVDIRPGGLGIGRGQVDRIALRDDDAIARLHADSWRRNYRRAYYDAFLAWRDATVLIDSELAPFRPSGA